VLLVLVDKATTYILN